MLDSVTRALATLETGGVFATELTLRADRLALEVDGVGPLRFPISPATARKLCAVASPAPFGRRERTLLDRRVRDTWEIAADQIRIDDQGWDQALAAELAILRGQLGLPEDGAFEAIFDKLLVYGPGQFFAPHQDSERDEAMIGTLVVELPSAHEGGELLVEHHGESRGFPGTKRATNELGLYAFYADCHHEVRPVKTGYRITIGYHLLFHPAKTTRARSAPEASVNRLEAAVKAYFATPSVPRYGSGGTERPSRLVYLLDHDYSQKSLSWDHLKNGDRLRALALRQVAERLGCEVFLALADVHESWSCEEEDYGYRRRRWSRRDDEPEVERDAEEYALLELINADVELRHWIDAEGKSSEGIAVQLSDPEICFTRPSSEMNPFKSEHEGNMGNYGNTVDRWYHRAALVMWPMSKSFELRAQSSPSWGLSQIASSVKRGATDEAITRAKALLPFWNQVAREEPSAKLVISLLGVLSSLGDAELSHALLAPFGPDRIGPGAMPRFVALVERFGFDWSKKLFSTWYERPVYYHAPVIWKELPRLGSALLVGGEPGRALSRWLLSREAASFQKELKGSSKMARRLLAHGEGERIDWLLALLETAASTAQPAIRDELLAFVMAKDTAFPLLSAGALLKKCRDGRDLSETLDLGLGPLHEHLMAALDVAIAQPERELSDWSIEPPRDCACALCRELASFLRDGSRIRHAWPLAKDRRQHVHHAIDSNGLPVTHETLRTGSPHTLVLTKTNALFQNERALRAEQKKLLAWLVKERGAFAAAPSSKMGARAKRGR